MASVVLWALGMSIIEPLSARTKSSPDASRERDLVSAFLHESFVLYNPVYLFSAALVLAGLTLLLVDAASDDAIGGLGVGAIGELYAFCLIGGAALLARIGQRRVAVMLGLLAALYQCDLTMNAERAVFLDAAGMVGVLVWIALFHLKLRLLARALELTPSRSALWVPSGGAAVLALVPQTQYWLSPDSRTQLVAWAVFAIGAAALWTTREVHSAVGYDYRGRRAILGTWFMWGAGALLHVGYWCLELGLSATRILPALLLLGTRWAPNERWVWKTAGATVFMVAWLRPDSLPSVALMAAATFLLHALRSPVRREERSAEPETSPYRHPGDTEPAPGSRLAFELAGREPLRRMLLGALVAAHLAAWTHGAATTTTTTLWMPHVLWADLALLAACGLALHLTRHWQSATPALALAIHLAFQRTWLRVPDDAAHAGGWAVAIGFALLGTSLWTAWSRRLPPAAANPHGPQAAPEHR